MPPAVRFPPTPGHPAGADLYRRQARRLRGAFHGQPGRLHRKLRELADRQDAAGATPSPGAPVQDRRARAFAEEVAGEMVGPVLPYSRRRALLASAERAGMGRFEANLIIAAVRHRHAAEQPMRTPVGGRQPRRRFAPAPLLVVLAVEALLALGVWRVCVG